VSDPTTTPPGATSAPGVRSRPTSDDDGRPFASVVVPVYDDPEGLRTTLSSLVEATYPRDRHEVIVVDNGSTDRTPAVAEAFAGSHDRVRSVVEPRGGSYAARNAGIEAARGSVLCFVDADMTVPPDWLERVVERMAEADADYLACDVELAPTDGSTFAERYVRRTAFPIEQYVTELSFAPTCCLCVRAAVIEDVGAFDERMTSSGDREFGNRVAEAGYDLQFAPEITMTHPPRRSVADLIGKAVRIGRGTYQLRRYHASRYGSRLGVLVNPGTYAPPLPSRLARAVRGWEEMGLADRVAFGLFAWALVVARAYGKLRGAAADVASALPTGRMRPYTGPQ